MGKRFIAFITVLVFFLLPTQVFAVDYSITDVEIDAKLQSNGDVFVKETHTYAFKGEFGGIIRELIPKQGTDIVQFEAFEGNTELKIETNKFEHRIHRSGKDETIVVELYYVIQNGVDVYPDVAEFYWPFFDRSNESMYENLVVTVIPPESTKNVIAFGYDEAYEKEVVQQDGSVKYKFGTVPRKTNGDIRVAYEPSLFTEATITSNKPMRDEIVAAKQQLLDDAIAFEETREALANIAYFLIPIFSFILLLLFVRNWLQAKTKREAINRELDLNRYVPEQVLSMPTTIFYSYYQQLTPELIAATLLDLVRKGHVKTLEDHRFRLVNRKDLQEHETIFIEWLFDEMGHDGEFSFNDLTAYTKKKKNHEKYQSYYTKISQALRNEIKEADLYKKSGKYRWMIALSSLILLPFLVLFIAYDLIGAFVPTLFLFFTTIIYAIAYHPKTWVGAKITYEWRTFRKRFKNIPTNAWQALTEDEKMRAFIFCLGIKEKSLQKKNETLIKAFKSPVIGTGHDPSYAYSIDPSLLLIAAAVSTNFKRANTTTAESGSGSSSSGGGGGGVGGGGGGSGAF
ncbi:DUF2207 domain-containing protein [Anaerobacillus isosaccharinicus]|uniref:DUF2207 domain-containing protein n=1 Tax=Anaerobacillus isosaccharinicus TaxID=1532552 RepID=A0A1S2LET0_9BACI|nr:DUF2207 domain-containing protein [Anaerobacillus isosaccharinicus]MBA5586291.1 DUF2207 domain-containing protein [Anaerobacillus isosaccharinicus]QOY35459.1 DUF2207 domain-containing protein [Anaerobacillus isosaccharinicus]